MTTTLQLPSTLVGDDSAALVDVKRYFGDPYLGAGCYVGAYFDGWARPDRLDNADRFTSDDLVSISFLSVTVPPLAARALLVTHAERFCSLLREIGPDRDLVDEVEELDARHPRGFWRPSCAP